MPRLNNKDFTVEELERLIHLTNNMIHSPSTVDINEVGEVKELLKGTTLASSDELFGTPRAIEWCFSFKLVMPPMDRNQSIAIRNAMRSSEVNETIKARFGNLVYEELNRYNDQIRVLMLRGDSNVLE